ncbi:hypothetical protein ACQKMD_21175 [Viridibacillus sp. NPDC096237]
MISEQETFTLSPYMTLYAVYQFDEMIKGKFPLEPTSNGITEELAYYR